MTELSGSNEHIHQVGWCSLSGFDRRNGIDESIRERVHTEFGDEVRAELPRRAVINEAFQLGDRLGDYADATAKNLARIFRDFLERDLLGRNPSD